MHFLDQYPACLPNVSNPACIKAHTLHIRLLVLQIESVSVSVLNVVSRYPALAPPIASEYN